MLRAPVWVFVGVHQEWGETCLVRVTDLSTETLLAIIKACIFPSTTIVSDCGYVQRLSWQWRTHTSCRRALCLSWIQSQVLTQIRSRPHGKTSRFTSGFTEKTRLNVINRLKCSLSAGFDDVPELIVKRCVQFITTPLVHTFHVSFLTGYFPNT
jgi:hypothetical protein